jgi:hypothetical protein
LDPFFGPSNGQPFQQSPQQYQHVAPQLPPQPVSQQAQLPPGSTQSSFSKRGVDLNGETYSIQKTEYQDANGNFGMYVSRSIGNVSWIQSQLQSAQGQISKRENFVNMNERELPQFEHGSSFAPLQPNFIC